MTLSKLSAVILLAVQIILNASNADDHCDCSIYPYVPTPPCFQVCFVGTAANASPEALQNTLGLSEKLANKISSLDDLGVSFASFAKNWERNKLSGSDVKLSNGANVGKVLGYYREPRTNQLHFAVDGAQTNSLLGIPVNGTTSSQSQTILLRPHTAVYFAVDQPTWLGSTVNIRDIPSWTPNQLTTSELKTLREKMMKMSPAEFGELNKN